MLQQWENKGSGKDFSAGTHGQTSLRLATFPHQVEGAFGYLLVIRVCITRVTKSEATLGHMFSKIQRHALATDQAQVQYVNSSCEFSMKFGVKFRMTQCEISQIWW